VELLDGDECRRILGAGLGYSRPDRDANIERITYVCKLLSRHGVVAIAAAISPYRAARERTRAELGRFVEVYVKSPLYPLRHGAVSKSDIVEGFVRAATTPAAARCADQPRERCPVPYGRGGGADLPARQEHGPACDRRTPVPAGGELGLLL
jgi:hypothetical protein